MIVGAPLMAAVSIGWPRRRALLTCLSVFFLSHVVIALCRDFWLLLAMRGVAAVANAGFLAVGLSATAATVESRLRGRATSVLLSGVTVSCVIGVPAGAVLGEIWGWRSAFWAVSIISVPAMIATVRSIPAVAGKAGERPSALREARALKRSDVILILLLAATVNAATTFTYVSPLVVNVTRVSQGWVPAVLALFGAGSFVGSNIGGRLGDARPRQVIGFGAVALFLEWVALSFAAADTVATLVLLFLLGVLWFAVGSTLVAGPWKRPGRRRRSAVDFPRPRSMLARRSPTGRRPRYRPGSRLPVPGVGECPADGGGVPGHGCVSDARRDAGRPGQPPGRLTSGPGVQSGPRTGPGNASL
ncbi:MFS transporter [Streptomyces sp. NPDC021212]|uniref:MFS transporter n=1 Tax=Streptomyces sp. NPDC021212 TaxID=3365118 RepID=UPI0037A66640